MNPGRRGSLRPVGGNRQRLRHHGVDLVCLAGYMRLCSPVLLKAFQDRILNIHPSLLPEQRQEKLKHRYCRYTNRRP